MIPSLAIVAVVLTSASAVMAQKGEKGVPVPSQLPIMGATRSQGCWSAKGDTWKLTPSTLDYPSSGSCTKYCAGIKKTVAGLRAEDCYCGDDYPPKDSYEDDSECSFPCPGYDPEACGNIGTPGAYSVFNTGVKIDVPNAEDKASSTTSSSPKSTAKPSEKADATSASSPTSASTGSGSKQSGDSTADDDSKGSNTVGIAVGVVVGLVLFAAAIIGGYLYMRKKKRQELAEERRRAEAVSAFTSGASKPGSISGSFFDSRLDPVMANRRMSDGSIADNEDYSRKILRVTNA